MKIKDFKKGFTLIELMIVITVIAILAGMVLFGLGQAQRRARDTQRAQIVKALQNYLQSYASDNTGGYPSQPTDYSATSATNIGGVLFSDSVASGDNCDNATGCLGSYLGANNKLTDPGCGAGSAGVDINSTAAAPCSPVVYYYQSQPGSGRCDGAPYQIVLVQEGGGTQYFCGPRD